MGSSKLDAIVAGILTRSAHKPHGSLSKAGTIVVSANCSPSMSVSHRHFVMRNPPLTHQKASGPANRDADPLMLRTVIAAGRRVEPLAYTLGGAPFAASGLPVRRFRAWLSTSRAAPLAQSHSGFIMLPPGKPHRGSDGNLSMTTRQVNPQALL